VVCAHLAIWPNAPRRQGCIGVPGCCCLAAPRTRLDAGESCPGAGTQSQAVPRAVTPREALKPEERATIALFRQASPSVVFITTLARQRDLFSLNMSEMPQGSGSGFIWDQEGHIITNFHVIQDASGAKVTLADHSEWDAQLVGWRQTRMWLYCTSRPRKTS